MWALQAGMVGEHGEHATVFTWGLLSAAIKCISQDGGWGGFRNKCAMQGKYFEFPKKPAGKVPSIQGWSQKAMARSLQTGALCEEPLRTCCRLPPMPARPATAFPVFCLLDFRHSCHES